MREALKALLLTVVSAIAFGLAFPPTSWLPLAWFALVPFFVALRRGSLAQALLMTWLWSLIAAYVVGDWFPRAVASYFLQPMAMALALFVGVFTTMAVPYYMAFAAAYRWLSLQFSVLLPFLAGAAWVAAELGRGRLFTGTPFFIGNPWGLIGYSQTDYLPLVQIASVTGVYGVGFVVACVNAALAELWIALENKQPRRALLPLALAPLPAVAVLIYGYAVLRGAGEDGALAPPTTIAVIQGNLSLGSRWQSDYYGKNLDIYLSLTHEASARGAPEIVFWPEAAMTFFLEEEPLYQRAIARLLAHDGFELVAGAPRSVGAENPAYFNSIYLLAEDGSIRARYDKEHLVPFAEYFPFRIDVLKRRFGRARVFAHGERTQPLPTRAGPAGIAICNEVMLPEVVAKRVAQGAVYLVNPSNDTWISDPKYTQEQFDIAVMRAVEQRRYLVRASTAGPSAIVDPWGRIQVQTQAMTREVILGEIRPIERISTYGRVGDLFAFLCLSAVILALVSAKISRRDS